MHNNWEEMLPFYIAGTLPKNDTRRLEKHLSNCEECRKSLAEWQRIAEATRAEAASQMRNLPPLSPQILSLASQQAGARASQPLVYDFARGTGYRSRYRSTTVTLVAAAFTVFLIGGLLTLLVLSGALPSIRIATPDSNVVLLPTETETPTPTESITPVPSQTDVPPSATVVPSQTGIPATITPVPSQTDVPPSATVVPSETLIPLSPTTVLPSPTTVPPSATQIPPSPTTVPPTSVPPSSTNVPPTAIPPSPTTVPPTAVPPSATPQPQIIVIEPSATPITPTQIVPTRIPPTIAPSTSIPPTRVPPTVVPPTTVPATEFVPPTDAPPQIEALLLPESTEELPLFLIQSMMAVATCTAQGAVAGGAVDLHTGPGEEYAVISSFTQGDELTVLALSDNGWVRVEYSFDGTNEGVGWVLAEQVFLNGDCADLPVISAEAMTDETPTPESTEAVVIAPESTDDVLVEPEMTDDVPVEVTSEAESTAEPESTDDTLPTDSNTPAVVISVAVANLRSGPGTSYAIVGTARAGESLPVTAQMTTASGVWYRARKSGQSVWVSATVARLTPAGAFVPAAPTLTPSPTSESTDEPAPTDAILSGDWSQTVTVLSVSCDVTPPAGGVVPVSLLVAGDLITVFDASVGSPYTVARVGEQTYGGSYTTASATVSVSLTFSTASSFYGSAVATGTDGCVTQSALSGVYGG